MIINKTPHPVIVKIDDDNSVYFDPIAPSARVSSRLVEGEPIDGIPFGFTVFGEVENLPEPRFVDIPPAIANTNFRDIEQGTVTVPEVYYIVSQIVIAACPERADLVRPDTGPDAIRDADGRIVAVRRLTR